MQEILLWREGFDCFGSRFNHTVRLGNPGPLPVNCQSSG
jgi:hypothetical protein